LRCFYKPGIIEEAVVVDSDISKMIRTLRTAGNLTQEQLAAKIGVTVSTVNRWENGKSEPSPLAMLRIERLQKKLQHHK
jgi:putative transcriptional regulator